LFVVQRSEVASLLFGHLFCGMACLLVMIAAGYIYDHDETNFLDEI
jgi:hypothetical protein